MPFTTRRIVLILCLLLSTSLALCACGGGGQPSSVRAPSYHSSRPTFVTTRVAPPNLFLNVSLRGVRPPAYKTTAAPVVGEVFTTTNGTWTNAPTSFTYQWKHCLSAVCTNASGAGATTNSYTVAAGAPAAGDVGDTIEVVVTATNTAGSASQTSAETGTVVAAGAPTFGLSSCCASLTQNTGIGSGTKQVVSATPTTSGRATTLSVYLSPTATTGTEQIRGVVYADSAGAPGARLAVSDETAITNGFSAGWYVLTLPTSLQVTAGTPYWIGLSTGGTANVVSFWYQIVTNATDLNANTYTSGPSDPFGAVTSQFNTLMAVYGTEAVSGSPLNAGGANLPAVSGTTTVGSVLTTTNGTWTNTSGISYAYRWQDCTAAGIQCVDIPAATSSTYTLVSGDSGGTVRAVITATNATGSTSAASAVTGTITTPGGSSVVASTPDVPTGGTGAVTLPGGSTWAVAFADGFGTTNFVNGSSNTNDSSGCGTGGTCRDAAFRINWGQGTTLHQGSNPGSEVEAFSSTQTSVQSDGLHNRSTYTPHVNSTLCTQSGGCNYTSGEIATDYSTGFHWNAGGGALWVLEANIKWAPQFDGGSLNGGNDDALWGGRSGADEYDTPEHFGYGGGIAPPGTGACSGCTFNTAHMASTGGGIGCVSPQCTPCGSGHTQQCTEVAYKWFNSSGSPSYGGGYSYSEFCNCDPAAAFHTYDWVVFADGHFGMYMDGVWAGTMSTATAFTGWQYMIFFYASRCVVSGCLPNGFTGFQGGGGTSSRDLTMRSVAMYVDSAHNNSTNVQNGRVAPGTTIGP